MTAQVGDFVQMIVGTDHPEFLSDGVHLGDPITALVTGIVIDADYANVRAHPDGPGNPVWIQQLPRYGAHQSGQSYWVEHDQVVANIASAAATLATIYADGVIEIDYATACTVTIPPESGTVHFKVGITLTIVQVGAGQLTVIAGSGVTIRKAAATLKATARYSVIKLYNRAADDWVAYGDLAAS